MKHFEIARGIIDTLERNFEPTELFEELRCRLDQIEQAQDDLVAKNAALAGYTRKDVTERHIADAAAYVADWVGEARKLLAEIKTESVERAFAADRLIDSCPIKGS